MSNARPHFWDIADPPPSGAWGTKRRLADALRELVSLCVTTDAPVSELALAADAADAIAKRLAAFPRRTFGEAYPRLETREEFAVFADRGTLVGRSNPFAPPMRLSLEGDTAVAHVAFGPPFEGIPGHVHGGMVAAAFDQLFGYLQVALGKGSLTGSLSVRYRRPTPLQTELRLEGTIGRVEGRKSFVTGRMLAGGVVTAEAEGLFIAVDATHMNKIVDTIDVKTSDRTEG